KPDSRSGFAKPSQAYDQIARQKRPAGREHTPDIETKPGSRCPERRRVQFGKVNRKSAEDSVIKKAKKRQKEENCRIRPWNKKSKRDQDQAAEAHNGEDRAPSYPVSERAKAEIAAKRTYVQQHDSIAHRVIRMAGRRLNELGKATNQGGGPIGCPP